MKNKKVIDQEYKYFVDKDRVVSICDIGKEKTINEDRCLNIDLGYGYLSAIFDGMGATDSGEFAGQISVDAVMREFRMFPKRRVDYSLERALQEANRLIMLRKYKKTNSSIATTATAILFQDRDVCLSNIGNSRAYLIRGSSVQQLTTDHTYVEELLNLGKITEDEAKEHAENNVLTKALGIEAGVDIDTTRFWIWDIKDCDVNCNDIILLCSDGLHKYTSKKDIIECVNGNSTQKASENLLNLAKERGASDNITITIIPIIGQLKNTEPFGYNKDTEFYDENIGDDPSRKEKIICKKYILHLLILTILTNIIACMYFLLISTLGV